MRTAVDTLPPAVLPTVFVPGPAKSGTSFLFDCLVQTFSPVNLCGVVAANWSDASCGTSNGFLLSPRHTVSGGGLGHLGVDLAGG